MPLPNFWAQDYRFAYLLKSKKVILCHTDLTARNKNVLFFPNIHFSTRSNFLSCTSQNTILVVFYQIHYIIYFSKNIQFHPWCFCLIYLSVRQRTVTKKRKELLLEQEENGLSGLFLAGSDISYAPWDVHINRNMALSTLHCLTQH